MLPKKNLFYEWNHEGQPGTALLKREIQVNDETLRDGIQASGIKYPTFEEKIEIINLMVALGIDSACIGFPASGSAMMEDLEGIIHHIQANGLHLNIACAARTVEADIAPIVQLSQKFGISIDANIFVGSSPIRQYVEGWDKSYIVRLVKEALTFAGRHNLPICFITEDTTRSRPDDLREIYLTGIEYGAYRICLCDTVGYAEPEGVVRLVSYMKSILNEEKVDKDILLDWHGHNDRGLALANALTALAAGVDRVHATGLGIGERAGNTSMEQLLVNLKLSGLKETDLLKLKAYCLAVSRGCGVQIPFNLPIMGAKVFTTASGVHAAAILKAKKKNNLFLADRVYSGVPAAELGFEQEIDIGPLSGKSNFSYLLEKHNIHNEELLEEIYAKNRSSRTSLSISEIDQILKKHAGKEVKVDND